MSVLEENAWKCYGQSLSLEKDEFVEMMLLDVYFIFEIIRKYLMHDLRENNDPIFKQGWMLPLSERYASAWESASIFVLWQLFSMTLMPNNQADHNFYYMIPNFLYGILPGKGYPRTDVYPVEEMKYLVGFIHDNWLHSPSGIDS